MENRYKSELPFPVLTVEENLELHQMRINDAEDFYNLINSNRQYLKTWLPWLDDINSINDEEKFIESTLNDYSRGIGIHYGVKYKGQMIGNVGLNWIDYNNRSAGVGYWISEKYAGRGIITKCCKKLMDHCFYDINLHRFVLEVAVENYPSIGIAKNLGMRLEGKSVDREWLYDHFTDSFLFAITIDEVKQLN